MGGKSCFLTIADQHIDKYQDLTPRLLLLTRRLLPGGVPCAPTLCRHASQFAELLLKIVNEVTNVALAS